MQDGGRTRTSREPSCGKYDDLSQLSNLVSHVSIKTPQHGFVPNTCDIFAGEPEWPTFGAYPETTD